jgi:hypothetical protein
MILLTLSPMEILASLDGALLVSTGSSIVTVKASVTVLLILILLSKIKIPARQSHPVETKLLGMTICISVSAALLV